MRLKKIISIGLSLLMLGGVVGYEAPRYANNSIIANAEENEEFLLPKAVDNRGSKLKRVSSLYPTEDGYIRVLASDFIHIEFLNDDFEVQKIIRLERELRTWGGFYAGVVAYYLVEGQDNEEEDDNKEVIRIIKYDKDWNRIGAAEILSKYIRYPFDASCVEMTEKDGKLYIATGREGYVDAAVGQGHQGYLMITVDTDTMEGRIVVSDYGHSFAQYIVSDSDGIYITELREGMRCATISRISETGGTQKTVPVLHYGGKRTSPFAIATYSTVNGIAISENNILTLGTSIDQSRYDEKSKGVTGIPYNLYLTVTPRDSMTEESTQIIWLTDYPDNEYFFEGAEIVKAGDDKYIIMWQKSSVNPANAREPVDMLDSLSEYQLHYLFVNGNGEVISEEFTADAPISSCKPVLKNNELVYCAGDLYSLGFYSINVEDGSFRKKSYHYAGDNALWDFKDGVLTISGTGESKKLVYSNVSSTEDAFQYIRDLTTKIVVEHGITASTSSMFRDFTNVTEIILPDTFTKIGYWAFAGCTALTNIYIPEGVTLILDRAFEDCSSLTELTLPNTVTKIGDYLFWGCSNLKNVTVPYSVVDIGQFAFYSAFSATISGYNNSVAQTYAKEHGMIFKIIGEAPQLGDIDNNGTIDAIDATLILTAYAKVSTGQESDLTDEQLAFADVNADGTANAVDATLILSYYAYISADGSGTFKEFLEERLIDEPDNV